LNYTRRRADRDTAAARSAV